MSSLSQTLSSPSTTQVRGCASQAKRKFYKSAIKTTASRKNMTRNPLFYFLIITAFEASLSQIAPKVAISFPDIADNDFLNETMAVMSNSDPIFQLNCNASYPVEFIIHYSEEDDGTSEKAKVAEVYREVQNFLNSSSYEYSTTLRMEYKGKLLVLANFSCKATHSEDPKLQTHIRMRDENKKSIIILEISNRPLKTDLSSKLSENSRNCNRAEAIVSNLDELIRCFKCVDPKNGEDLELDYFTCLSITECKSIHRFQNRGKRCLQKHQEQPTNCKIFATVDYNPKAVVCKNFGPALAQFYYAGVFHGNVDDEDAVSPPIYFDWTEIDPLEMLYLHPIPKDIYKDEEINVTCEYSRFYFALGSWFGIENQTDMRHIRATDIKPAIIEAEQVAAASLLEMYSLDSRWRGTYTATLSTTFSDTGLHKVYCFGPVWNSTEWVNTSRSFNVTDGEEPKVVSINSDDDDFIVGQRNRTLTCSFTGKPTPAVYWSGPKNSHFEVQTFETGSLITFSEVGYQTSGKYTCTVSSFLGTHSKSFDLNSDEEYRSLSPFGIAAIVLTCIIVTVIVGAVILRTIRIINEQQEALRLLTEAEIEEFIQGNPEIIAREKEQYFDKASSIDALPYDQKYEIPANKLSIDYSYILGCGEFGLVLKGKVESETIPHYVNISLLPADSDQPPENVAVENTGAFRTSVIDVAVKTCKKEVDVVNFKALLSEIKVMAYLGHHANLVSLVGASTQNIRNRELYVAVEYCKNGSLDVYLKKNKGRFVNKVKYGYVTDDNSEMASYTTLLTTDNKTNYVNTDVLVQAEPFSTTELFQWANEIAEGVGYIHSRRVIHGDLAIRNVLLDHKFTAKVGDFGLSRQLVETASYTKRTQCPLPWRNMSLESLKHLEFSVKSDMWALAVTFWELFSMAATPYPGLSFNQAFMAELEQGTRLPKPLYTTNDMYEFMLMCWNAVPEDRPGTLEANLICNKILQRVIHDTPAMQHDDAETNF